MLVYLPQAQDGIRVDVRFGFRPRDHFVVRECRSRPSNQSVVYSEFWFDGPISISASFRINSGVFRSLCSCTLSKCQCNLVQMGRRLSLLSTKITPRLIHWSSKLRYRLLVTLLRESILPQVLEDFLKVSMVGGLHVVEFQLCPSDLNVVTSLQFPGAG